MTVKTKAGTPTAKDRSVVLSAFLSLFAGFFVNFPG